jgi:small subunit ribosomal protein S4e
MAYLKRQAVPKSWPIPRKGTKYVVRPNSNLNSGIPVLILLRDLLGFAKNNRELKKAIASKQVCIDGKITRSGKNVMLLFDVLTIVNKKKNYRLILDKYKKFALEEIKENEAGKKIVKIVNKKTLNGKQMQINLSDGRNILVDRELNKKCKVNDSVLINFKENKIEKILELKEKAKIFVFGGKHTGKEGVIKNIDLGNKAVEIESSDDKKFNVLIKQLIVVE